MTAKSARAVRAYQPKGKKSLIALHAEGFLGYPFSHGGVKSEYEVRIGKL